MELTARYLKERFKELNETYFDSELPMPLLAVSKARTRMGTFSFRKVKGGFFGREKKVDFAIRISEYFRQTEEEIDDTLLHEMIHYKIAYKNMKDSSPHGHLFHQEMERLNALGRHITVTVAQTAALVVRQQVHKLRLVLAMESVDKTYYLSVINPAYKNYVERQLNSLPTITRHQWVVTTDPYFNDFPQARSLRARRVTKEIYLNKTIGQKKY